MPSDPRLFDRYVVVDWSAAATPRTGKDSVWIADLNLDSGAVLHNPSTRSGAGALVDELIADSGRQRVLIGFDAGLGYPTGSADLFGFGGVPWRAMWRAITERSIDGDRNTNNRFEVAADLNRRAGRSTGPFWGCPSDRFGWHLARTKPATFPVQEYREVERALRSVGRYPKSCWQLLGAGSVGSQTLTLLPILSGLLDRVEVWPFTTGLRRPGDDHRIVVAEIWPTMFVDEIPLGAVPDAVQVAGTSEALRAADRSGELAGWFEPSVTDQVAVESEEGWILGVTNCARHQTSRVR
ncbi:MAG: cobalamin biosynthesis protein CbiG [Ilumatobacteraceae bacterium]